MEAEKTVSISTEYIKLDSAMKLANAASSGGEAKVRILGQEVTVNGEVCTMRGKKLRSGDCFSVDGHTYRIIGNAAE